MIESLPNTWGKSYNLTASGGSTCTMDFSNVEYEITSKRLYMYGPVKVSGESSNGYTINYSDIPNDIAAAFKKLSGMRLVFYQKDGTYVWFELYGTYIFPMFKFKYNSIQGTATYNVSGFWDF